MNVYVVKEVYLQPGQSSLIRTVKEANFSPKEKYILSLQKVRSDQFLGFLQLFSTQLGFIRSTPSVMPSRKL